jgi:hypothetical protein
MAVQRSAYSSKPLYEKLGLKPGQALFALRAPKDYGVWLELPPSTGSGQAHLKALFKARLGKNEAFIHAFFEGAKGLEAALAKLAAALAKDGTLWVSWRKGKASDLTEEPIRAWALAHGLVDVKVCSVSEEWSGLKLVWRKENR